MREMIKSLENSRVKQWARLLTKKGRMNSGLFLVEGHNIVNEATATGNVVEYITTDPQIEGILVSETVMKKITGAVTPQSIVAVCRKPSERELGNKVLVLRNVQDPGNVGTLIRTAKAFNFTDVIVQGADPFSDKSLRSSQGAIFKINLIHTKEALNFLNDHTIIASLLDKEAKAYNEVEIPERFALIMGNEGQGIDQTMIDKSDMKVYIPIEFESLNVAIAGGILMNEYK
ncbi:TrmH family RNA methyltransferase [Mycoplasma todarodis]|uniref:rRNA methyltransferase n=1 Tax=Mycoplasma todarodis TaxID=1937191 RepID=A0A4R0XIP9_9MOLU|nr:RNA methyltransferase [Mycoplasma todarodis]TCG10466.1 rRNA methyltransferase [Mycoplasma todarodis]